MHAYNRPAHSWGPVSLNVKPSVYSHGDCRELRSNLLFRLVCASVYVFFHFAALRRAALLASQTYAYFVEYFRKFFPSPFPSIVKNLRAIWRQKPHGIQIVGRLKRKVGTRFGISVFERFGECFKVAGNCFQQFIFFIFRAW